MAYYNGEADIVVVYDLIDMLYKLESERGKITIEVKAIKNVKWKKFLEEWNVIRGATWPNVDTDISIWEVIVEINALPLMDSD